MATLLASPLLDRLTDDDRVRRPVMFEIRARAEALPPRMRTLMHLYWEGHSQRELAALMGMSAGGVHRLIRRIATRLKDPLVVALAKPSRELPPLYRQVGLDRHLAGHPLRAIAAQHQIPRREVERILAYLDGWAGKRNAECRRRNAEREMTNAE